MSPTVQVSPPQAPPSSAFVDLKRPREPPPEPPPEPRVIIGGRDGARRAEGARALFARADGKIRLGRDADLSRRRADLAGRRRRRPRANARVATSGRHDRRAG